MLQEGIQISASDGVGTVQFSHPKANSLPTSLLRELAEKIQSFDDDETVRVILLRSGGEKAFCAGASFDELRALGASSSSSYEQALEEATEYFLGFAQVILALRNSPKCILTRVQGKSVGGAVGLIAASDYVVATEAAALRLSELSLGFGPFVISLPILRKVGVAAFEALSYDTEWRSARWAYDRGLYHSLVADTEALDQEVLHRAQQLADRSADAVRAIKSLAWDGCPSWEEEFRRRARLSAKLVLREETQAQLHSR
ncbi:enoyl-CoA hydratase/isomerase family protein [bacterium]|nr:enoyl-CoA hydratase/isomerase family protein [bacterium]